MRVLFITHYATFLGANRSLLHLVAGLMEHQDVNPLVLCPGNGEFVEQLQKYNIPYRVIPFVNSAYTIRSKSLYLYPYLLFRYQNSHFEKILSEVRKFSPDLIHSNSAVLRLGTDLAEALDLPHSWHIRSFGWADYQLVFPGGKKRVIKTLGKASAVICISKKISLAWKQGNNPKAHIIYNGVGTQERITARKKAGIKHEGINLLAIGLLHPQKGQIDAVRLMARLKKEQKDIRLTIAGNGRKIYTFWLKALCSLWGLNKSVQFTGYVSDPAKLYASSDLVLMCSRNEAMGRVTAEAMSYGIPVIGFNGGATPELVEPGETGYLYNSIGEMKEQVLKLVSDPILRKKMGENAHNSALDRFTDERYTQSIIEVLRQAIGLK